MCFDAGEQREDILFYQQQDPEMSPMLARITG